MSNYRRAYIPGGTYFFTVVTYKRKPILCSPSAIQRLKDSFNYTKEKHPFSIEGLVILPDHIHCIWQLPEKDSDFSKRWNMIKRHFSLGMTKDTNHRREKNIWQRRFWEHAVRDEKDFQRCLDYIYYNPVKHGYVQKPLDWIYSTFKRDVAKGFYSKDWGSNEEPHNIKTINCE
jgi:putative transposase